MSGCILKHLFPFSFGSLKNRRTKPRNIAVPQKQASTSILFTDDFDNKGLPPVKSSENSSPNTRQEKTIGTSSLTHDMNSPISSESYEQNGIPYEVFGKEIPNDEISLMSSSIVHDANSSFETKSQRFILVGDSFEEIWKQLEAEDYDESSDDECSGDDEDIEVKVGIDELYDNLTLDFTRVSI